MSGDAIYISALIALGAGVLVAFLITWAAASMAGRDDE